MLHILLAILKIMGMILLVIIGLILLICACILFVPIRYGAWIKYDGVPDIRVKATYLLHIISVCVGYQERSVVKGVKIFGIKTHFLDDKLNVGQGRGQNDSDYGEEDLFDEIEVKKESGPIGKIRRKVKRNLYKRRKSKEIKKQGLMEEEDEYLGIYETEKDLRDLDNVQIIEDNFFGQTDEQDTKDDENAEDLEDKNIFATIKSKIIQIINKIKYHFGKICGTIRKVFEGIKKVRFNVNNILDIINDDINREAFTFVKGETFKVIGHVKPKKVKGYVRFGLDDPYNTGRLLGIMYAVLKGVNKNLEIKTDFDNKVLEADVIIKGRIQLYYLLIIAYRIYKNESFKKAFERRRKNGR